MRDFNVMLTCCANHVKERVDSLKNNEDNVKVGVYAVNCAEENLPSKDMVDGRFVVPPISSSSYRPLILDLCKTNGVDIIIPTATIELQMMADNKDYFERHGIKVSIASPKAVSVANNKITLHHTYPTLMPNQMIATNQDDVTTFKDSLPFGSRMCCKLSDHAGGNGFAIVDDEKSIDITLFNKLGVNRYISTDDLCKIVAARKEKVILQEYVNGYDYSVCVLAVNGVTTHIVGYKGNVMSYGAVINGEIQYNGKAYEIAEMVTKDLGIDGNACFDFMVKENGDVVLLEVNPRVSASLPFVGKAGVNMLYLRCKNLLGDYSDKDKYHDIQYGLKMKKFYESRYFV